MATKKTAEAAPTFGAAEVAAHNLKTIEDQATSEKALADLAAAKAAAEAKAKADADAAAAKLADAPRLKRWEALVESFKKERPAAYEARKHTGEFDTPPADFV